MMRALGMHVLQSLYQRVRVLVLSGVGVDDLALGAVDLDARGAGCDQEVA